jgi:APA family basic amino acid/polyamine antiporter
MSQAIDGGHFKRGLGLFDASMLVAGTMIGSGIFIVSAGIARDTGGSGWLLVVWAIAGMMTILGALAYSELAGMMPHAGGQYVFLRESYGKLPAFLFGWTTFTIIQTGTIAAVGVAFAKFLGVLVPVLGTGPEAEVFKVGGFHVLLELPLPWLSKPLNVFERTEFTITAGQLISVVLVTGLTYWNSLGVTQGKWLQNVFTVAKIGALALLIVVGLTIAAHPDSIRSNTENVWAGMTSTPRFLDTQNLVPLSGEIVKWMVIGGALVGALFSADAWANVTFAAAEVRNPARNLPLAMILGTGLVIALYLLANIAYLSSLPLKADSRKRDALVQVAKEGRDAPAAVQEIAKSATPMERGIEYARDNRVGTAVLETALPAVGVTLMALAIMVSTFGCLNGLILTGPRLYYAMANDGLFFQNVGRLNRSGVPAAGLWFQAIWACLLCFSGTYDDLLDYVIFAAVLFYGVTAACVFVLRFTRPNSDRPVRAFGYPVLPALYVALCVAEMLTLLIVKPTFTWPGLLLVIAGVPVYFLWRGLRKPAAA